MYRHPALHGVVSPILAIPTPGTLDQTNDGLPTRMHMDVLDGDLLLSFATCARLSAGPLDSRSGLV